ncbi:MAG: hypothetical protein L0Y72_19115 [Gemmataceae bacterium]|nr:hypothetical protein [Gemmataceae bacterium]MCI0741161.1 hypothetical protein [Gemmataceae bacterium]
MPRDVLRFVLAFTLVAFNCSRSPAQDNPVAEFLAPALRLTTPPQSSIPVIDENRLFKGADGQWRLIEDGDVAEEQKEGKTSPTLRDEIAKMLTVNVKGKGKLQIYGFGRGDAYWGTSKFSPSLETPFFALSEDARFKTGPLNANFLATVPGTVPLHEDDSTFTMNARLSRLGVVYTGEKAKWLCDAELEARVEMDFYNTLDNVIASRAMPRIRLGYAKATWGGFSVMLGQNWDIISPLYPTINDDVLMWNAGNLGDRRPQLRLNWDLDLGHDRHFIMTVGALATDSVGRTDFGNDGFFDGEDTGVPGFQGRMAIKNPSHLAHKGSNEIGVWGLWSADATNVPIGLSKRSHFTSYVVGADWQFPLCDWLELRGEAWYGRNLDDYRGGIAQGVNTFLGQEIRSSGGWSEFLIKPFEWYQLALGATIDDPVNRDVRGTALPRVYNITYYAGNRFPVGGGLTLGLDFEFWRTGYLGLEEGTAERIKFWMMLSF